MVLGMLGLFLFGAIGMVYGSRVGSPWGAVPLLAWTGLFASLGWNFLDYGLLNPPTGEGIEWGWLIPGVMFEAMAFGPVALGLGAFWTARGSGARAASILARPMPGPGQPAGGTATRSASRAATPPSAPPPTAPSTRPATPPPASTSAGDASAAARREIAQAMGALVAQAAAATPVDPELRPDGGHDGGGREGTAFSEGTQALLDRLERLADLRDRGLLAPEEYETAKDAVVRELEARS
jgi:hypothetical protein